jgi:hypothetical protein
LERIISQGHSIDKLSDWREDFVLGRIEALGIAGEFHSGSTWRLQLGESDKNRWKIDVVDVSDSSIGKELVRNSLVGEPCDRDGGTNYPRRDSPYHDSEAEFST